MCFARECVWRARQVSQSRIPENSHVPGTGSGRVAPFRGRVENGCKGSGSFREG